MPETIPETDFTIRKSSAYDSEVRMFFLWIAGVPSPEYEDFDTAYEAISGGKTIGMAVVDTFTRPLVYGIGVEKDHRNQGVGSALLSHCLSEHDRVYCRVRKDNKPGIALCETVGMEQHESMWPNELWQYEASDNGHSPQDQSNE